MTTGDADATVAALLDRHGETFAEEIGLDLHQGASDALFQWLVAAQLYSARISADLATRAARALIDAGLGTPRAMCEAGWEKRVKVLNENGYARYDERTASMLGDLCARLHERWHDDLRRLRAAAEGDPDRIERFIEEFKGVGPTGAAIFRREAQDPWPELRPFADKLALKEAETLGLPADAAELERLAPEGRFTQLIAALVRTALARDEDAVAGA